MKFLLLLAVVAFSPVAQASAEDIENGERLFLAKCKGCHRLTEGVLVGPSLLGVTERRSVEWLDAWLKDPKLMMDGGDAVAVDLLKTYKKKMPVIPAMQDRKNREDVISYIRQAGRK